MLRVDANEKYRRLQLVGEGKIEGNGIQGRRKTYGSKVSRTVFLSIHWVFFRTEVSKVKIILMITPSPSRSRHLKKKKNALLHNRERRFEVLDFFLDPPIHNPSFLSMYIYLSLNPSLSRFCQIAIFFLLLSAKRGRFTQGMRLLHHWNQGQGRSLK